MPQTRREFLASAASTALAAASLHAQSTRPKGNELPRRVLGRTRESVSIIGLGCAYAGSGVSEAQTRATIEAALDNGIRYFDAAPEYEQAELRLGPVVKSVRDKVFLVTKSYALDAKDAERDLQTALRQLQTDHVDLFLQHGVGLKPAAAYNQVLAKGGSLEFMLGAKKAGLTRFIGMSIHPPFSTALRLLQECSEWDVIQPFLNYVTAAREKMLVEDGADIHAASDHERLLERARQNKAGIVGMKVLGGSPGVLAEDYDRAFRYALSVSGVSCIIIGVGKPEQVLRAVRAARTFHPMTEQEMNESVEKGRQLVRAGSVAVRTLNRHARRDSWSTRTT